jgi:polyribonucleotide nucleotidyltransferase
MTIGISKSFDLGDGKVVTLETGKLARQADGAVMLRHNNTMILATVVSAKEAKPGVDFMPLSVDYQEKFAAVGRIPGSFHKREAKLSDYEVLISRIVDRALRPLFPDDYHADTQVIITLHSGEPEVLPEAFVGLAASAALTLSDIPFNGPISEVRVGRIDGKFVINPYKSELDKADIDLIVAGTAHDINMVEGEMAEVSEADMLEALKFAHEAIKKQCQWQLELAEAAGGKKAPRAYAPDVHDETLREKIYKTFYEPVYTIAKSALPKQDRSDAFKKLVDDYLAALPQNQEGVDPDTIENPEDITLVKKYFHDVQYDAVRNLILNDRSRLDGRALDQVRPIWSEVDYLPSAHGSAVFTRGETQSLTSVTLGTKMDEQLLDSPMVFGYSKFLLHYNFPSFSTGEVKPNRGPGRREIGHGNLALRGLKRMLPDSMENPYTIRVVSDILESNGSSSMATVCAGSLALMDAGIKMRGAVSGIAMGLITDEKTGKYAVLSDILGDEDHLGDMDFKVVGTSKGIVACQMDIKINGLKWEVVEEALNQAKAGRTHIMNEMNKTLAEPRADYKPHAPRIEKLIIDKEFIGAVIGPGGKVIQGIQRDTNTIVSITEEGEHGIIEVASANRENMDKAIAIIKGIVVVPEPGLEYVGKVKSITDFGAFIEFLPGKEGLLHISEISWQRLPSMEGVLQTGEEIKVKLIEVDKKTGKYRLSRKVLLPKPEGMPEESPRPPRGPRPEGGNRGPRRPDGDRRDNRDRGPRDHHRKPDQNNNTESNTPEQPTGE